MKKILLATTLLAATTGFAAAEVALTGDARMGVINDGTDTSFSSRARVSFALTGETDGGLSFGAGFRADNAAGDEGAVNGQAGTVFISGAFGKLTMGDIGNAPDTLVGQVSGIGYGPGALDGAADVGFLADGNLPGAQYEYSAGALTVAIGTRQVGSDYFSLAAKYAAEGYSAAIGYEDNGTADWLSLGGSVTLGAATVKAKVADGSAKADISYALSVDYVAGATTVTAFYADDNAVDANYGLGLGYDLGGGAALKGGVGSVEGETVYDAGVTFSF